MCLPGAGIVRSILGTEPEKFNYKTLAPLKPLVNYNGPDETHPLKEALLLRGEDLAVVQEKVLVLKKSIARSRFHDCLALLFRDGNIEEGLKEGETTLSRAESPRGRSKSFCGSCPGLSAVLRWRKRRPPRAIAWFHLAELWDYVQEPVRERTNP